MYGTIYRDDFVNRMQTFQAASGWSRMQLLLLFDHLEELENETVNEFEHKFDIALLADWETYDSPDEFMELNDMTDNVSDFADYDNPEWDDIRNIKSVVLYSDPTGEGVATLH